jgi:RimJ/RimL family protein N-acetyltransferase
MQPAIYRVETPRLVLRCWSPEDATVAKRAEDESRDHLRQFTSWADRPPENLRETVDKLRMFRSWFDAGQDFLFGLFLRDSQTCVGGAAIHPRVGKGGVELGYWVHAYHVRQGFATEAAGALTRAAFECARMRWVEIRCARTNTASAGVARNLGFSHEATLRERLVLGNGQVDDAEVFTLFKREYSTSAARRIPIRAFDAAGNVVTQS